MVKGFDYQYVVIGSGAAGSAGALLAASMGVKTAIVEADRWGGTTLNYRDIPYQAALGFAQRYAEAVAGARFGMSSTNLRYNYPTLLNWQAAAVRRAGGGKRKLFEESGIDCYHGFAQFISPHEVAVDGKQISGEKFLLATGSELAVSGIAGIEAVNCWSPDTALRMSKVPKAVMVVGGGSTGCEIAEYFSALGAQVLITEAQERLLPREDKEAGEAIAEHLHKRFQVQVLTSSRVIALAEEGKDKKVVFVRGGQEKFVKVEAVVLATTPEPSMDYGLENAGIKYTPGGVEVNDNLRTTCPHIYAAGDILGGESSTERATYEAKLATTNALKKANGIINYAGFTRMTDTLPKVAKVGFNEADCARLNFKFKSALTPVESVSAANTNDFRTGFVKILVDVRGQILGATVVCPNADLVVQEIALAMRNGLKVEELAATPHVATSWSEAVRLCARELAV